MWGPRCGRLLHFCKHQVAPSTAPAPGGEKSVPAKRARDFFRAARSVTAFPLSSLRPKVLPALLLLTEQSGSQKRTPPRFVLWPWLLRAGARFPSPLSLPLRRMRRVFSATLILPARRERFPRARVFRDSLANPREKFRGAEDFLSEISRPCRKSCCARLLTIFLKPARAVRSIPFLRVLFREVFLKLPEFPFPPSPFAPRFLRSRVRARRAPSSPPGFPRGGLSRAIREKRRGPYL